MAARFTKYGQPFQGFATSTPSGPRWTGRVELMNHKLDDPLHWKKPSRVFVNSMSDLFHESLTDVAIIEVFNVMRQCPQHQFQVLTKRPERMHNFCRRLRFDGNNETGRMWLADSAEGPGYRLMGGNGCTGMPWVWLGVSVEDQLTANERIPFLLETPTAVRFVSAEPLLGPIAFGDVPGFNRVNLSLRNWWVIVGGESGPGARPCDVEWIRSIVEQCAIPGVPCFVKQLGAKPYLSGIGPRTSISRWPECIHSDTTGPVAGQYNLLGFRDSKAGDPDEWPEDLRVREFPRVAEASW